MEAKGFSASIKEWLSLKENWPCSLSVPGLVRISIRPNPMRSYCAENGFWLIRISRMDSLGGSWPLENPSTKICPPFGPTEGPAKAIRSACRSSGSSESSSRTPCAASPIRPTALRRGARMNPTCPALIDLPARPAASTSARNPVQRESASIFNPCRTRMRFSPVSGTTSATVARAT